MTSFGLPDRPHPLLQARDLDAVALVAVLLEPRRVGRHEGEPLQLAPEPEVTAGRVEPERDGPEAVGALGEGAAVVVEGPHPQPLGAQQVEVDVGDRVPRAPREPLGVGEQGAVLPDHRLAVPGEVRGRLALAGRRVDVRRQAPRRRRPRQQAAVDSARPMVIGLPDRFASTVAPASAAVALGGTGTHMSSQISTCRTNPGTSSAVNSRSGPNGTSAPARWIVPRRSSPGADLAALVELPVGRQVRLGRDAEQPPAVHDRGDVVDPVAAADGQADDEHRQQVGRRRDDLGQRGLGRVEQGVLQKDVLDRVAGERQFRVDDEPDALVGALASRRQDGGGVGRGVGDDGAQRGGGDAEEAVPIQRAEVRAVGHGRDRGPFWSACSVDRSLPERGSAVLRETASAS